MSTAATMCAYCQSPCAPEEPVCACPDCGAAYHPDCWQENGGCAVYGCARVPATEPRRGTEIPAAFWGRDQKPCPSCGAQILAAALRCRQCGATFASAQPEDQAHFQHRQQTETRLAAARRAILWQFVLAVIPCTAAVGAVYSWVWRRKHHAELQALPALYTALSLVGLGIGLGQTLLLLLFAAVAALRGTP